MPAAAASVTTDRGNAGVVLGERRRRGPAAPALLAPSGQEVVDDSVDHVIYKL